MVSLFLCLLSTAVAGDGPWTLAPGAQSFYGGANYYRYSTFVDGAGIETAIATDLTAAGLVGVYTRGLAEGLELELIVPYERVRANDPSAAVCVGGDRPADFCKASGGIGDLSGQLKWRVVDEIYASPVTVAIAAGVRSGEAYSERRHRLTGLGDGQTDVGAGLSLGRTDQLGPGWYRVGAWGWYWYRFPNAMAGDVKVPEDELAYTVEATISLHPRFGFGPAMQGFRRLGGVDVADLDYSDPNVWNTLDAAQLQVGGKLGIFAVNGPTVSLAVLKTVKARNNPSDTLVISVGIGWYFPGELG